MEFLGKMRRMHVRDKISERAIETRTAGGTPSLQFKADDTMYGKNGKGYRRLVA